MHNTGTTAPGNKYSLLPLEKQGLFPTLSIFVIYAHVLCELFYVNLNNDGSCRFKF